MRGFFGIFRRIYNWFVQKLKQLPPLLVILMTAAIPVYFAIRGCIDMLPTERSTVYTLFILWGFCIFTDIVLFIGRQRRKRAERKEDGDDDEDN